MKKMLALVVTVIITVVTGGEANGLKGLVAGNSKITVAILANTGNEENVNYPRIINWDDVPEKVRNKIIKEEMSLHPEIIREMALVIEGYVKTFGKIIGKTLGEAQALYFFESWKKQHVCNNLECVLWGNVAADFQKRDLTTVKKGDYLMLYKLHCEDAALYWGPVAATDKDHVQAGMTPGSRYNRDALVLDLSRDEMVHARPT